METKEIFAQRIIELRKEKGWNQAQLAEMVGVSRTSANLYESSTRVPDIQVLAKYAECLGVTADYLLGLSDNRTNETAAIGKKLGLGDYLIILLEKYNMACEAMFLMQEGLCGEEETALLQTMLQSGYYGSTMDEMFVNLQWIQVALGDVICTPKLLIELGKYWHGDKDITGPICDNLSPVNRKALALLQIQKIIMDTAEEVEKYYAQKDKRQE